jgi:hypothetical protein
VILLIGGFFSASAEDVYYVYLKSGGVEAFSSDYFAVPQTLPDGSLCVMSHDGHLFSFIGTEYSKWSLEAPTYPYFSSFKFNNKYNPSLHQDIVVDCLSSNENPQFNVLDTIRIAANSIGKRLTPSFRTSEPDALVYAEGKIARSKVSRYRFDHDIVFTVASPGCLRWIIDEEEIIRSVPLGHSYLVHVDWLTDNPMNIPRIDINIDGGRKVTSKDVYVKASFGIQGNGVYEDFPLCDVWIKGRGNTSWGWPKKPYRLKFDEKVSPFGLSGGKNWVLLSNYLAGSLFANALAFKSGQLAGVAACNHIVPVELYMNGDYLGNYMFTEKVGFGNNSLDADEKSDCLLELSREYDEQYRFRSNPYNLPVNIKEPDLTSYYSTDIYGQKERIKRSFNNLAKAIHLQSDEVSDLLDIDACARFLLVNDLCNNVELNHPKSTFLFKENYASEDTKYVFGPIWDFDWSYGFARTNTYFDRDQNTTWLRTLDGSVGNFFFHDLMELDIVKRYYYKTWMDFIYNSHIDELKEFVQDYYDFAHLSFEHDMEKWGRKVSYQELVKKAQKWLDDRAKYIVSNLTVYDLTDFETRLEGDVNRDGELTVTDALLTFDYIQTGVVSEIDLSLADVNYDGSVDTADVVSMVHRIIQQKDCATPVRPYGYHNLSTRIMADPFELKLGQSIDVPIQLSCENTESDMYYAFQCDIHLPKGLSLTNVKTDLDSLGYMVYSAIDNEDSRVVLMPSGTTVRPIKNNSPILVLEVSADKVVEPSSRTISITNIRLTTEEREEEQLHSAYISFDETTGLNALQAKSIQVSGGHSIVITSLEEQDVHIASIDGKYIKTIHVLPGRTILDLSTGVYVIAGQKAVVY